MNFLGRFPFVIAIDCVVQIGFISGRQGLNDRDGLFRGPCFRRQ